jgi:hypothetical protein
MRAKALHVLKIVGRHYNRAPSLLRGDEPAQTVRLHGIKSVQWLIKKNNLCISRFV